jgi:hypothetical protein
MPSDIKVPRWYNYFEKPFRWGYCCIHEVFYDVDGCVESVVEISEDGLG